MSMTTDHLTSMNSPAFRAWVDDVSHIDPALEPRRGSCDNCGTAVGLMPFVGDHCLFCAAHYFGRYEKSMELSIFVKLLLRTVQELSLTDLAQEVEDINWDCVLPLADSEEATREGPLRAETYADD